MIKKKISGMGFIKCIICGEKVLILKSTSTPRDTCPRVRVDNKMVKSDCERKKDQLYQKNYRKAAKEEAKKNNEVKRQNSFAASKLDHITIKIDNKKRKRFCLKCEKRFTAVGKYNRICPECKIINNQMK